MNSIQDVAAPGTRPCLAEAMEIARQVAWQRYGATTAVHRDSLVSDVMLTYLHDFGRDAAPGDVRAWMHDAMRATAGDAHVA